MARTKKHYARRAQLIDAATRAISERGRDNVGVRDIAARAGVSPGSVLYHYPELGELIFDVHRSVVERFYRRRVDMVEARDGSVRRLAAALDTGLPMDRDDEVAKTLFEMHGLAERSSPHGALMTGLFDREVSLYAMLLEAGRASGEFVLSLPAREIAQTLVVLEDGIGLHLVSNNTSVDRAGGIALMTAYASQAIGREVPTVARDGD